MRVLTPLLRSCRASCSRLPVTPCKAANQRRPICCIPPQTPASVPFFVPQFGLRSKQDIYPVAHVKGKGKEFPGGGRGIDPEKEVDDREWDMRVARAMLHLQETLPHFFNPAMSPSMMMPPDIYSQNMVLKLPAPLPLKISSLSGYTMAFSLTRSGMQALHTDLRSELDRMTFSPTPSDLARDSKTAALLLSKKSFPSHRQKQIRASISVYGKLRLPPHTEAKWNTSSLYTFHPASGLITSHVVETIRPLPGEGVAEWLMSSILGWTAKHGQSEAIPCPRAVAIPQEDRVTRLRRKREDRQE